jgi:hypothetical protein
MPAATKDELLRKLVVKGGRGTEEDVAAVRAEIARLSQPVLAFFRKRKLKVVACRDSVTDFEKSLRGKLPRGWDPKAGKTWDDVPGAYLIERKRIVVATIASGGKRAVPPSGQGHGSCSLALHEALHGHDIASKHALTGSQAFRDARTKDFDRLPDYERQEGKAGLEETFAESGALHYSANPSFAAQRPALAAWWKLGPAETLGAAAPAAGSIHDGVDDEGGAAALGSATLQADGSVAFDLRADEPGVALGHALFVKSPERAGYEAAEAALREPAAGDSAGPPTVLVRPVEPRAGRRRRRPG